MLYVAVYHNYSSDSKLLVKIYFIPNTILNLFKLCMKNDEKFQQLNWSILLYFRPQYRGKQGRRLCNKRISAYWKNSNIFFRKINQHHSFDIIVSSMLKQAYFHLDLNLHSHRLRFQEKTLCTQINKLNSGTKMTSKSSKTSQNRIWLFQVDPHASK